MTELNIKSLFLSALFLCLLGTLCSADDVFIASDSGFGLNVYGNLFLLPPSGVTFDGMASPTTVYINYPATSVLEHWEKTKDGGVCGGGIGGAGVGYTCITDAAPDIIIVELGYRDVQRIDATGVADDTYLNISGVRDGFLAFIDDLQTDLPSAKICFAFIWPLGTAGCGALGQGEQECTVGVDCFQVANSNYEYLRTILTPELLSRSVVIFDIWAHVINAYGYTNTDSFNDAYTIDGAHIDPEKAYDFNVNFLKPYMRAVNGIGSTMFTGSATVQ